MHSYLKAMRQYAVFRGRSSRREFWMFYLVYMIGAAIVVIIDQSLFEAEVESGSGVLTGIYALVHLLPGMAVLVRRLHDIDRSGWWALINLTGIGFFVLLVMAMIRGTAGPNYYGPPSDEAGNEAFDAAAQGRPEAGRHEPLMHAGETIPQRGTTGTVPPLRVEPGVIGDLERLAHLRANGSLTETEYEVMKARTLAAHSGPLST